MPIFDLYSKRQKRLRGEVSDVLTYDKIPQSLKVQIVHIISDAIGEDKYLGVHETSKVYEFLHNTIAREYGVFQLREVYGEEYKEKLLNFLLGTNKTDEILDITELSFKYINNIIRNSNYNYRENVIIKINADDAIHELNVRFKENGIGYSFTNNNIIRIDSTYAHSEITKPSLSLLSNKKFQGANDEYLSAHEYYKNGKNKECLNDCLKSFESTLKVICKEKGWEFNQTDTSKKLIQICFQNGLVPTFTQNQFTSLQNLLESGIPTIRNKLVGMGKGKYRKKLMMK
ncbi:STM4504/CBY_0614 family protein [Larkinella terrae]|uniref:STM4504/CBY_0614 family protein n=1 Tax=Larkinella terrae TaxID=2025311 RepID=UPI0019821727|nr:hypothetical protein [Larkinella terrae]